MKLKIECRTHRFHCRHVVLHNLFTAYAYHLLALLIEQRRGGIDVCEVRHTATALAHGLVFGDGVKALLECCVSGLRCCKKRL